ncbi:hypothetical protein ROA7450_02635 [Roseovarius albus]|uniref:Uncharacterized protein n=1 Tax=Roseovarius albus TaxID=1247867 RepID=A0A1X6ZIV5_9RHOB|nr:hypothetical protein [Roseovarius albus]SLN52471.1 hypothetical protein ROA7450_02635 [Roseovarius albus]
MDSIDDALKYQQIRDYGFNDREIPFYGLMSKSEEEICTYLPAHVYKHHVRNTVNSQQRQILSDKIAAQHLLNALGVRTPILIGIWDSVFGMTADGRPMTTVAQLSYEIGNLLENTEAIDLIFKPRDGGGGQYIFVATFSKASNGEIAVFMDGK